MLWLDDFDDPHQRRQRVVHHAVQVMAACVAAALIETVLAWPGAMIATLVTWIVMVFMPKTQLVDVIGLALAPIVSLLPMLLLGWLFGVHGWLFTLAAMMTCITLYLYGCAGVWRAATFFGGALAAVLLAMAGTEPTKVSAYAFGWCMNAMVGILVVYTVNVALFSRYCVNHDWSSLHYRYPDPPDEPWHLTLRRTMCPIAAAWLIILLDVPPILPTIMSAFVLAIAPGYKAFHVKFFRRLMGVLTGGIFGLAVVGMAAISENLWLTMCLFALGLFIAAFWTWRNGQLHYGWAQMGVTIILVVMPGEGVFGDMSRATHRAVGVLLGYTVAMIILGLPIGRGHPVLKLDGTVVKK